MAANPALLVNRWCFELCQDWAKPSVIRFSAASIPWCDSIAENNRWVLGSGGWINARVPWKVAQKIVEKMSFKTDTVHEHACECDEVLLYFLKPFLDTVYIHIEKLCDCFSVSKSKHVSVVALPAFPQYPCFWIFFRPSGEQLKIFTSVFYTYTRTRPMVLFIFFLDFLIDIYWDAPPSPWQGLLHL